VAAAVAVGRVPAAAVVAAAVAEAAVDVAAAAGADLPDATKFKWPRRLR